jgi:phosphonatase-like hydrolase
VAAPAYEAHVTAAPAITLACCGLFGTTVVDDGLVERAFAEAIATQGVVTGTAAYARGMADVHRARGQATGDMMHILFPDNAARAQAAHLAFDRSLSQAVGRFGPQPMPGAREVLDRLAGTGVRICLFAGVSRRLLGQVLGGLGWQARVDLALSADDVPRGCPAPDLVLAAMLRLGVTDVRETAVVAGTASVILAGRRAGAGIAAGVLTGTHPAAKLRQAGATHVLTSIAELPAVLAAYPPAVADDTNRLLAKAPGTAGNRLAKSPCVSGS